MTIKPMFDLMKRKIPKHRMFQKIQSLVLQAFDLLYIITYTVHLIRLNI